MAGRCIVSVGLVINSVSLNVDGCCYVEDHLPLLDMVVRGDSTLIPGVAGRDPNPVRIDELITSVRLIIMGRNNFSGGTHSNARLGIYTNILHLLTNVATPGTSPVTRTATFTLPSGLGSKTCALQVLPPFQWASGGPEKVRGVLRLRIPAGVWT